MRGISFRIYKKPQKVFDYLFKGVPLKEYDCYLQEEEFFSKTPFPEHEKKIDEDFFKNLKQYSSYCVSFLNLQVFEKGAQYQELQCFEDYEKSCCQFAIFITDGNYFEIYSKKEEVLMQFIKNAIELQAEEIEIITHYNDGRYVFSVL